MNFTTGYGDQVSFDRNGDALPIYDVLNWYGMPDGTMTSKRVGVVDEARANGKVLSLDEDQIFWNFESNKVLQPPFFKFALKCIEMLCSHY